MYEVYVCKLNDEVLYVGQGKLGRHNHCKSGCSHVYELNKLHFSGVSPTVEVVHINTQKEVVLDMEKKLIKDLKPKYNVVHMNDSRQQKASDVLKFKAKMMADIPSKKLWIYSDDGTKYKKVLSEFMSLYHHNDYMEVGFKLRSKNFYYKLGLGQMSNFVRSNFTGNSTSWKNVFKDNLLKHTKVRMPSKK